MLLKELPALVGDTTTAVWAGGDKADTMLKALWPVSDLAPGTVARLPYDPDDTAAFDAETVLVAFAGPDGQSHIAPEALAAPLRRLPSGGRVVLLLGWPVDELPYHVLVAPLVAAGCQVLQAVPLDGARLGAHCAVVAARVSHLAPPRTYLDDSPIKLTDDEPDLRTLLRLAAEHTFADLVSRPLRIELAGLRDRVDAQQERIRQLEEDVRDREAKLTAVHQRLAQLRASTKFQVGDAVVQGARRPGRAIISVPFGLVRVWRNRSADRG